MPPSERRNSLRRLPAPWNAEACCFGASATERFGEIRSGSDIDDATLSIWIEGEPGDTLALWELLIRSIMAGARDVPIKRLAGRRPPWTDRFRGSLWVVSVAETDGLASASCVCVHDPSGGAGDDAHEATETGAESPGDGEGADSAHELGAWGWHAVGTWSLAWPAVRLLADALAALGARVTADIEAEVDFATTGPVVSTVGAANAAHDAVLAVAACSPALDDQALVDPTRSLPHAILRPPLSTPVRQPIPGALTSYTLEATPATVHAGRQLAHACAPEPAHDVVLGMAGDDGEDGEDSAIGGMSGYADSAHADAEIDIAVGASVPGVTLYVGCTPAVRCPAAVVELMQAVGAMLATGRGVVVTPAC